MPKQKKRHSTIYFFLFITTLLCAFSEEAVHVLQRGETLYGISKKYHVPLPAILEYNKIKDGAKIKAGEKIIIPNTYTVKDGDTLYGTARKFGIQIEELMRMNSLTKSSIIKPGDILIIPGNQKGTAASAPPQKNITAENQNKTNTARKPVKQKQEDSPRNYSSKHADTKLLWPVPASKISYISGKVPGVVIDSKKGEAVKAVASGKVISAGIHRGFGKVVFIQSETKHIYVYGGMEKISVKANQKISLNQKLGELGTEAFTGTARLYFIVYEKNKPVDPAKAPRGF